MHNTSKQPDYGLYVSWQLGTVRMGKPDLMARLMPGREASFERAGPQEVTDPAALGAFVAVRDAAGIRWDVREGGTLTDIALPSQGT
jgi:hypothetical protein